MTNLNQDFKKIFNTNATPLIVRSPGRVNIIGEHTDYNEGFVLPAAIDKYIFVAIAKRDDDCIKLYSQEYLDSYEIGITEVNKCNKQWCNYILGIVNQLQKCNHTLTGFNLLIHGNIPIGAGLSSSAAVECATIFALNQLYNLQLTKMQMAKIAQQAEHDFAGVNCGIMDMFASLFGKQNCAISLDCKNLSYNYIPLQLQGYKILLLNTNVKHQLASTEYNTRYKQCQQGVALIQQHHSHVQSLRDVTMQMLQEHVLPNNQLIYNRCKYVVQENERLQQACNDLQTNNIAALGQKMFLTHYGLSNLYEVSCSQLDLLVSLVQNNPNVLGARMMGGGFGGCTINIVAENKINELINTIQPIYESTTGLPLTYYIASVQNGTEIIS